MADQGDASQEEVQALTNQFYVTLKACVARLRKDDVDHSPESFAQVEELLKDERTTWSNAYQIEQLLVDLFDEGSLEVELQSRLLEAKSNLGPALSAQYSEQASAVKTPHRALLARLVNDLQWRYTVNEVKRAYSKEITKITGLIFIATIGLFAAAVIVTAVFGKAVLGKALPGVPNAALLFLAGMAGGWGAGFSMVASLKGRLDAADLNDLKLLKSKWVLWSRPLIGVGAACILYLFLVSGLLGGNAFPRLDSGQADDSTSQVEGALTPSPETAENGTTPNGAKLPTPTKPSPKNVALLVVWCFVAGFSERLVPALLAKTESRAIDQSSLGPDRFKPGPAAAAVPEQSNVDGKGQGKKDSQSAESTAVQTTTGPTKTS